MATASDPRDLLEHSAMNGFQVMAVVICTALNALDGYDVLAISFELPDIAAEWPIKRAELGDVLAMWLVVIVIGSITLGGLAHRIGRRSAIFMPGADERRHVSGIPVAVDWHFADGTIHHRPR